MHDRPVKTASSWQQLLLIIAALTVFRLVALQHIELVPDEAYYWLWSRVPSSGYYDHPPMIAWWIWASTQVLGNSELAVRLLPVLSVSVASVAVYGTAIELYGDKALAMRAAVWLNAMLLVALAAVFATPDAPSLMFWSLALWALARLRQTAEPRLWIVIGLLAGAGCVGKYTNFFLGPGILLWIFLDPKAEKWRYSPWLLAGGAAALLVFLPVLVWNAEHGWVSFIKQFGRIGDHHFSLSSLIEFLAGQFGLMTPPLALLAGVAFKRFLQEGRHVFLSEPSAFLASATAPILVYLLFHALRDRVHANWPLPAYPALAIAAASGMAKCVHVRRLSTWVNPIGIGLSSLLLLYFASPLASHFPWSSPADNILGWRSFAAEIDKQQQKTGATWIATTDYGLTGELAFYSGNAMGVQAIVERRRYVFENPDQRLAMQPALLVVRATENRLDAYLKCFASVGETQKINRMAGSRVVETYLLTAVSKPTVAILTDGCRVER